MCIRDRRSHARRLHGGAIVVKDDRIISIGYNGMPAGWDNNCEDKEYMSRDAGGWLDPNEIYEQWPFEEEPKIQWFGDDPIPVTNRYKLKTKPEVLHAERNALDKLAKGNEGGLGSTMFITHAPCLECAKSIYGAGISHVFYRDSYRSEDGIQFLTKCGVSIEKLSSEVKKSS
jgi:dCMP deaminase